MARLFAVLSALASALVATAALGGAAHAGGSVQAYVQLPAQGRLALVDVDRAQVTGVVAVPRGAGPIAASIDGSRILVGNTRGGVITEVDGITRRRVRTVSGLGHPVAIAFVPGIQGLVRPRYAVVADVRGWIDLLDLRSGDVVRRVPVPRPVAVAVENGQIWVASAQRTTLSQLDVTDPPRVRLVAQPDAGVGLVSLAIDSASASGVDGVTMSGHIVHVDGVTLAVTTRARLHARTSQLLAGYNGELWATGPGGRVFEVGATKTTVASTRTAPGSRLAIIGGWLADTHGDSLSMFALGSDGPARSNTSLPGAAGVAAFAVR